MSPLSKQSRPTSDAERGVDARPHVLRVLLLVGAAGCTDLAAPPERDTAPACAAETELMRAMCTMAALDSVRQTSEPTYQVPAPASPARPVLKMPEIDPSSLATVDAIAGAFGCLTDGTVRGEWLLRFGGYGCAAVGTAADTLFLALQPAVARRAEETHASLLLGPTAGDAGAPHETAVLIQGSVLTTRQLRAGSAPNPWEVGWLVWHYADDEHFYYFIAKPNGWELGKRDPSYPGGQRFLATGSAPRFPIGVWHDLLVTQSGPTISVRADAQLIVSFDDRESAYSHGKIGVYSEDAAVIARGVRASTARLTPVVTVTAP